MSKNRLEAFSDGVFAIAITLLVLGLLPERDVSGTTAMELIVHAEQKMLVFVLSFVIVGTYWVAHHRMLHFVATVDRTLLWLNLALLMVIAFMPFPTALVGETHAATPALRLYGVTLIAANTVGTLLLLYGTTPALGAGDLEPRQRVAAAAIHLTPVAVYIFGIAVAATWKGVTLGCYAVVPAFFILFGPWVDHKLSRPVGATRKE